MHETKINYFYIKFLLDKLKEDKDKNSIPINSLLLFDQTIIGYGQNKSIIDHAECIAIKKGLKFFLNKNINLNESILFTSLEPCLMCTGLALNTNIKIIYYACRSPESGIHTFHNIMLINKIFVIPLLQYESEFQSLLKNFYQKKRY